MTRRSSSSRFPPADPIVCGDNLAVLRALPTACCDLIYVDPPFYSGRDQKRSHAVHKVADRWSGGLESYLEFLKPRLVEMHRCLKESGTLYLHLDWHAVHYARVMLDELFGVEHFLNEIIWSYRTGGVSKKWFGRKHDNILVYARCVGKHTFHVQREGLFRTDGMKYDDEGKPFKSTRNGPLYFHADGPALTDVWDIPFLSTVSLERTGYPTQKPVTLLERIIKASTNEDDVVADFFCGSGTTLVAARKWKRRYFGCDQNPQAVEIAKQRLKEVASQA